MKGVDQKSGYVKGQPIQKPKTEQRPVAVFNK